MDTKFDWCGYGWNCTMEGGRIIHPDTAYMWYDNEQVKLLEDNSIELTIEKKPTKIKYWDGRVFMSLVACGLMRSIQSFSYGTFSTEIKLPKGKNLWPCFWLVGDGPWPGNGEIDIVEAYTNRRSHLYRFPWWWDATTNIHALSDDGDKHIQLGAKMLSMFKHLRNPSNDFVTYECVWTPDEITLKVNNKIVRQAPKEYVEKLRDTKQFVIFDFWTKRANCNMKQSMLIKNFKYQPL